MKVALVYDRVNKWGGAERVLLALKKIFPQADLYTSVYYSAKASWAKEFKITTSFLQSIPLARKHHELFSFFMPLAFESFHFENYDLVISVTSESAKGIITRPGTTHVCICLTPTRYLWSGYEEYFRNSLIKLFAGPVVSYLRAWDKIAAQRPDVFIAISREVQKRIKQFYNRDSIVVYPSFTSLGEGKIKKGEKYFLVVSRLSKFTGYKHVELAVEAATKLGVRLKVIGDGNVNQFKKYAGPTVEFIGRVSDHELADYYTNCDAVIFPGVEDFGLVMVEVQAYGKPVIAFRGGGALEIVKEGVTGEFFNEQTVESLCRVLEKFSKNVYNSDDCKKNGERFSFEQFKKGILSILADLKK